MDWNNVTARELLSAFQEVEWRQRPPPLTELLSRFSLPRTVRKWQARGKNNAYYYRTHYLFVVVLSVMLSLIRRPFGLMAVLLFTMALLCLNNTVAASLSDTLISGLRRVNVRLAQRLRAAFSCQTLGYPDTRRRASIKIGGLPRSFVVAALGIFGLVQLLRAHVFVAALRGLLVGDLLVLLHATFRSPNLKARLGSAREEFRALWRGYQQQDAVVDYTL